MASKKATQFDEGDKVKWTSKFLKSTGQYTNVPAKGEVIRLSDLCDDNGNYFPVVHWEGREYTSSVVVHPCNIMLAKKPDTSGL